MFRKSVWIPILSALLFVIGCGLFYGRKVAHQEPIKVYKPVDVKKKPVAPKPPPPGETHETGHWHGDEWHTEPHETHAPAPPAHPTQPTKPPTEKLPLVGSTESTPLKSEPRQTGSRLPELPPSAVPDNIPEHLKFPSEFKNGYYSTQALSEEEILRLRNILKEIVRDYNPGRSRASVWPQFIAAENAYRAQAAQELGRTPMGIIAGGRYYYEYEQTWAYPEIMECFLTASDPEEYANFTWAHHIAMGDDSIDHNVHTLEDGREFRMRYNNKYVFKYYYSDAYTLTVRDETAHAPGEPRPEVVIDVLNTSDAELERLSGWDFRINPITMQPF